MGGGGGGGNRKVDGVSLVSDVMEGAMRAASLDAAEARATSGAAGAASARRRVEAEEPGSAASAHAASNKNIRKTLRAVPCVERAARLSTCFFNCKASVVCRDLAGVCGDVITEIFSFTFEGRTQDGSRSERKKYAGVGAKNYVSGSSADAVERHLAHAL